MRRPSLYALVVLYLFGIAICLLQPPADSFDKHDVPKFKGDDNPAHDGQPAWCQSHDDQVFKANCHCQATPENGDSCKREDDYGPDTYDEEGMPRCSTSCRRTACLCGRTCST